MKNSEQPIYPIIIEQKTSRYATVPDTILECKSSGLTKREYFAAMAMQGILSGIHSNRESWADISGLSNKRGISINEFVAISANEFAEALLTELEKLNQ